MDPWEWQTKAFCSRGDFDPEDWFQRPEDPRTRKAKARCGLCPVRGECLEQALAVEDTRGVWGGLDATERTALLRRQPVTKKETSRA